MPLEGVIRIGAVDVAVEPEVVIHEDAIQTPGGEILVVGKRAPIHARRSKKDSRQELACLDGARIAASTLSCDGSCGAEADISRTGRLAFQDIRRPVR